MKKNRKLIFGLFFLGFIVLLVKFYPLISLYFDQGERTINQQEQAFFVKSGTTLLELDSLLKDKKIIAESSSFLEISKYKKLDDGSIGAGKYIIQKGYKVSHLVNGFKINALGNGNGEVEVKVAFDNCRDIQELAGKICRQLEMDSIELIIYLENPVLQEQFGFKKETFSSMFIPDTYNMFWDIDPASFTEKMAGEFKRFWTPTRREKSAAMNLSQSEVVTLASVVYAEQSLAKDEWPIIAGLYLNRIKQGMKLQSDPTFKFCWGRALDGNRRLYNKHREIDCPYNTYKYFGLPPGPINIPPAKCIDAVLNYEKHNYIYMCAQNNNSGKHFFESSYDKHQKNAEAFRKWMNANGIR